MQLVIFLTATATILITAFYAYLKIKKIKRVNISLLQVICFILITIGLHIIAHLVIPE
jgi:hypothetical protein